MSRPRLKDDIQRVGTSPSGISIYEFSYFWDSRRYRGVMAQELLETHPQAVSYLPGTKVYGVDYDQLDVDFEVLN